MKYKLLFFPLVILKLFSFGVCPNPAFSAGSVPVTAAHSDTPKKEGKPNLDRQLTGGASVDRVLHIGILDYNEVWGRARAPLFVRETIQRKRREYQREIIALEEKLRRHEDALRSKADDDSSEAYKQRRKKFELEVLDVQKKVQRRKQELEEIFNKAMTKVGNTLKNLVAEIAEKKELDLILSQTHVAFNNPKLTITEEVIAALDLRLPTVNMDKF